MAETKNIYGEVDNASDVGEIFDKIRRDVKNAKSREALTELYRRAGYMITLTYAPSWEERFGAEASKLRKRAESEFRHTAKAINQRAEQINTDADYDEAWGEMKHEHQRR
ncbi:MAG TPA: hypothetical protein VGS41_12540 [Chthonomonadales bacterium]|nr:hypothetical protein [Chthonomonadales bacterium]